MIVHTRERWALVAVLAVFVSPSSCTEAETAVLGRLPKPDSGARPDLPSWAKSTSHGMQLEAAYTSLTRVSDEYKMYHNMWYHNSRWYAILPADKVDDPSMEDGISSNIVAVRMPVTDLRNLTKHMRLGHVKGNSLLIDFPFPALPDHLGHWLEMCVPVYNLLHNGSWVQQAQGSSRVLDQVVLPNLGKTFSSWVKNTMAFALSQAGPGGHKPVMIDYYDFEAYDKLGWILFENLIIVQDRYSEPNARTGFKGIDHGDLWRYDGCDRWVSPTLVPAFAAPEYGNTFRLMGYLMAKRETPSVWLPGTPPELPRFLTLLLPADDEPGVVNKAQLIAMLHEVAQQHGLKARPVSLTSDVSYASHLDTIANSAVLVARQSPLMASTVFMAPGSMVLELLPFKWEWHKLSMLYYNMTQSIGDIHHFAWRAASVEAAVYKESHGRRYKDWLPGECHARECLKVQASADLVVDVEAVKQILLAKLPKVLAGEPVDDLAEPWPEAV